MLIHLCLQRIPEVLLRQQISMTENHADLGHRDVLVTSKRAEAASDHYPSQIQVSEASFNHGDNRL